MLLCLCAGCAAGQDLEPRSYSALPKDLNIIVASYGITSGNVLTDAALPFQHFHLVSQVVAATYLRSFELDHKLARIQVTLPAAFLLGNVTYNGKDTSATRSGLGDAVIRFGYNFTGSPPLDKRAFTKYTQETIFGASLVVKVPTGTYYPDKLINIGSNRLGIKPEVGVSKRINRVFVESYAGIWFYTLNYQFLGKVLKQEPVFQLQGHVAYYFKNMMMLAYNVTWFTGGQTSASGKDFGPLLNNWRMGATWSCPITRWQILKLQFSGGVFSYAGYNYKTISVAYQWIF